MKKNTPILTHTETLAYAIMYVNDKYRETEDKAAAAEQQHNFQFAEMIREAFPWKAKLAALCKLYEMETGSEHEFNPEVTL